MGMAIVLAGLTAVAVLAPLLAPADPDAQVLADRLLGPGAGHLLGTDDLGRDHVSRLMFATRLSILAAVQATVVSLALGVPVGLVAGYARGRIDSITSRFADALMSMPGLLLAMAIIGVLGPGLTNAMFAIGVLGAPRCFRVARSATLAIREETYIEAARSIGGRSTWIVARHVLPNVASPLIVQASLTMGFAILIEASISFLGLGVQPPDASLGSMLGRSVTYMEQAPHLVAFPGLLIFLLVLGFNTVGDGIRDSIGREVRA